MKTQLGRSVALASVALASLVLLAGVALATITFDAESGTGFVGKGDVQYTLGWNNKQLQDNAAAVKFQVSSEVVTEVSWICTNTNNENTQERERTTTTTVAGLVESIARERNQITGFNLLRYDGDVTEGDSTTEGPAADSCPSGPWTLTTAAGDPEFVSSSSALKVSGDAGTNWTELLEKP